MARRLILPLILLLALTAVLVYVGGEQVIRFEVLPEPPGQGKFISMQAAIILGAFGLFAIVLIWSLIVWLWKLPKRMKSGIGRKREDQGLDAVEQALLSVEAGDVTGALKKAKRAFGLLNRPSLTALISAKAAELAGEHVTAEDHYKTLADNPKTEIAGLHGLARLAKNRGDHKAAIHMAKTVFNQSASPIKNTSWAFELLFNSQISEHDWAGALETLELGEKRKLLEKDEARRRRSVLLSARASELETGGEAKQALGAAKQAASLAPGFAPAAALAARLYAKDGQSKKAAQLIEKSWAKSPHPALALAYKDLWQGENVTTVVKKIRALIKTNPTHRESVILSAELALDGGDGVAALAALDPLLQSEEPSARLCVLSARAEDLLKNTIDARTWQHRAACAPVEANWSDLDPEGEAFNYTNEDWRRLMISFGNSGTLIHPRHETYKARRPVIEADAVTKAEDNTPPLKDESHETPVVAPSADDPGVGNDVSTSEGLADRLENLLDDDVKS